MPQLFVAPGFPEIEVACRCYNPNFACPDKRWGQATPVQQVEVPDVALSFSLARTPSNMPLQEIKLYLERPALYAGQHNRTLVKVSVCTRREKRRAEREMRPMFSTCSTSLTERKKEAVEVSFRLRASGQQPSSAAAGRSPQVRLYPRQPSAAEARHWQSASLPSVAESIPCQNG